MQMHFINFMALPVAYGALQKLAPRQSAPPPSTCIDTTQVKYFAALFSDSKCKKEISGGDSYVGSCYNFAGIVGASAYIFGGIPKGYICDTSLYLKKDCIGDSIVSGALNVPDQPECLTDPDALLSMIKPTKYNSIRVHCYQVITK